MVDSVFAWAETNPYALNATSSGTRAFKINPWLASSYLISLNLTMCGHAEILDQNFPSLVQTTNPLLPRQSIPLLQTANRSAAEPKSMSRHVQPVTLRHEIAGFALDSLTADIQKAPSHPIWRLHVDIFNTIDDIRNQFIQHLSHKVEQNCWSSNPKWHGISLVGRWKRYDCF